MLLHPSLTAELAAERQHALRLEASRWRLVRRGTSASRAGGEGRSRLGRRA